MVRCIKLAKNGIQQWRAWLAERTRAGAGRTVVMGLNPSCLIFEFFFFLSLSKVSKFFGGLVAGTRSENFSVPVPGL